MLSQEHLIAGLVVMIAALAIAYEMRPLNIGGM